jgi:hypothetical protein
VKKTPISTIYSMLGWSVIPTSGKQALVPWKEFTQRRASVKEQSLWAERFGEVGVGIVTGSISRLIVLDADGPDAIAECERLGVVKTPTVLTPRDGKHYYFRLPEGALLRSQAKLGECQKIDIRSEAGIVAAPNTKGKNGKRYEWELRPDKVLVAKAPAWLLDLCKPYEPGRKKVTRTLGPTRLPQKVVEEFVSTLPAVIQTLIRQGHDLTKFPSRSECDFAVILALLANCAGQDLIQEIFSTYPIGEKYLEAGDRYLARTFDLAVERFRTVSVKYADLAVYGESRIEGRAPGARLQLALEVEDEVERGRLIRCGLTVPDESLPDPYRTRWEKLFQAVDVPAPLSLSETKTARTALIGKKLRVELGQGMRSSNPVAAFHHV